VAGLNLVVNAAISAALYGPFEIAGIVLGTVVGTIAMCVAQGWILRRELNGIEGGRLVSGVVRMTAAAALLGVAAYFTWKGLDEALGRSLAGQAVSVLTAIAAGSLVYAGAVWVLGVPEAKQIPRLLGSGASTGR
jgi:putative peptidoglycan lipid II flippase